MLRQPSPTPRPARRSTGPPLLPAITAEFATGNRVKERHQQRTLACLALVALLVLAAAPSRAAAQVSVGVQSYPEPFGYPESVSLTISSNWDYHGTVCPYPIACEPYAVSVRVWGSDGFYNQDAYYTAGTFGGFYFTDYQNYQAMQEVYYSVEVTVTYLDRELWVLYADSAWGGAVATPKPPPPTPMYESSTFLGYAEAEGFPTFAKFMGSLWASGLPLGSFAGRMVRETDPGGGSDGCWLPGDPPSWKFDKVSGAEWGPVNGVDDWQEDVIGFIPHAITYYRLTGRAGCSISLPQRMEIRCDDPRCQGWWWYQDNMIYFGIETDTIWQIRQAAYASRVWL